MNGKSPYMPPVKFGHWMPRGGICIRTHEFANQLWANCELTNNSFSFNELQVWINFVSDVFRAKLDPLKVLAWCMGSLVSVNSATPETSYRFGLYVLDPVSGTLTRNQMRVRLQEQPFQLLLLLVERAGQIVSREEIRNRLWPQNTFVE